MLLGVASMDFMTGATGTTFFLVDVQIMQILLAIAEVGKLGTLVGQNHLWIVAIETQSIQFFIERRIELFRIRFA